MLRTTESVLLYSFIFPRVPSVSSYWNSLVFFHEIFKNLAVVQRHHIMPRKWDHFRNSFRSFYDPLNFLKWSHFLGVIWCLCTAARFLNISWKNMREEEEQGGTRGNMLHLIVVEYSCSLKWKMIKWSKRKRKRQEKARKFAVIFENVFLFGLLRSVVRMLRTSGTRRNTREYEAIHQ